GRELYRRWRAREVERWGGLTDRGGSSAWFRKQGELYITGPPTPHERHWHPSPVRVRVTEIHAGRVQHAATGCETCRAFTSGPVTLAREKAIAAKGKAA